MQWSHTRREFLTRAVGANIAVLLAPEWLRAQAEQEDPRVAEVLSGTIGIDMHNHVTPGGERPEQGRKEQQKSQSNLDLADEIKRSGLTAVCAAFRLNFNAREPYATFLQGLTAIDGLVGKDRPDPRHEPERPPGRTRQGPAGHRPVDRRGAFP